MELVDTAVIWLQNPVKTALLEKQQSNAVVLPKAYALFVIIVTLVFMRLDVLAMVLISLIHIVNIVLLEL